MLFDATQNEPGFPRGGAFLPKIADATEHAILFHCVDHLPAEMPKEASNHFGEQLCPFIKAVADSDFSLPLEQQCLPAEIEAAVITCHGELASNYKYIARLREVNEKQQVTAHSAERPVESAPKGLRRNTSCIVLGLEGHLFDTKCFNDCIDICERHQVRFSIVSWEVGNSEMSISKVTIQMTAEKNENLSNALDIINETTDKLGIEIVNYAKDSSVISIGES